METIKINNLNAALDTTGKPLDIKKIARYLAEGKVVILPTATIYGLSCKYNDRAAIERIYDIKKRNTDIPFIILISSIDDLENFTSKINITAEKIIEKFWHIKNPRPLTLVFEKKKSPENFITGSMNTVAIRMAELKFLRDIIDICGPIVSTSATISGIKIFPKKVSEIPAAIRKQADLTVESQTSLTGGESTIISVEKDIPVLIREGRVKFKDVF
jgi:L-threonylcarbamoyladenylate synthase